MHGPPISGGGNLQVSVGYDCAPTTVPSVSEAGAPDLIRRSPVTRHGGEFSDDAVMFSDVTVGRWPKTSRQAAVPGSDVGHASVVSYWNPPVYLSPAADVPDHVANEKVMFVPPALVTNTDLNEDASRCRNP